MNVLALDQGTTSTRAVVVGAAGDCALRLALPHRQIHPHPGWVEHDPEALLANLGACLEAGVDSDPACVGLANQGESCLAWDAGTGAPLSPVIVWQDARTAPEIARLRAAGAEALTLARAGLPLDVYFSAARLGWLLRHVPGAAGLAARGRLRLGTTDAFFRQRLTGICATDPTTASRTSLMDLERCCWDPELCALFGVPIDCLPEIRPSTGALGTMRAGGRALPLTASVVDQQAAVAGHGCTRPGDAKITFGTGAFALVLTGALQRATAGPLPTVAWARAGAAPVYALEGGVHAAAAAVNWARGLGLFRDWAEIAAFDSPAVARGLTFVPALAGLACPHWDRGARGAWMGLGLETTPRDMAQAVLEGVAFRAAEVMASMAQAVPLAPELSIDGGISRNRWFCKFLADALGRTVRVSDQPELTALGAAALAAEGAGIGLPVPRRGLTLSPRPQPPAWAETFAAARAAVQGYSQGPTPDPGR